MNTTLKSITPQALAAMQATGAAFTLIDVRRDSVVAQDPTSIAGATWHNPAQWLDWKDSIPTNQAAVVYCAKGHEISQGVTAMLAALGVDASFVEGGYQGWKAAALPMVANQT
jgi:thiosulfate sulfurtransferase